MDRYTLRKYAWAFFAGFLALCLLFIRLFQAGVFFGDQSPLTDVVVTEIGARNDCIRTEEGIHDYIELYNPTAKPINLSGLGISDGASSARGTVSSGTRLGPGEYKLVALGKGALDFGFKSGPVHLGIYDAGKGEYIGQGKEIQKFFQMVQDGIGLPLP